MSDTPATLSPAPEAPQDDGGGHTKLPWAVCKCGKCRCGFIWDAAGNIHVATVHDVEALGTDWYGSDMACSAAEREANAHLIVTAVNAFESNKRLIDDLVAALEKITKTWDGPGRLVDKFYDTGLSKAVEEGRASLFKAKAKPGEQK